MAINLKFDLMGNPEPPSIVLANRNGNKLGQLDINIESIDVKDSFNSASEFSFTLNKYIDGELTHLWDKVVDFKLVYCPEWDTWFEIKVELDETTETVKTVYCTQLGQAELSQIMIYNIEINTEADIEREEYRTSILYDEKNPKSSILHRLLEKAPHYSIAYVDESIQRIQRQFSFDGVSICDAFNEISEEVGCLFVYNSNSQAGGKPNRTISVYDLQQNCKSCGHRGEFTDKCPECESTDIEYGYGEDTEIFVSNIELATEGIQLVTDTDSVKNCFKLEGGDDLMTATIRNCNPNGSDYIWYFSGSMKEDMSSELVNGIETYDEKYRYYYNDHISELDGSLVNKYNALVEKFDTDGNLVGGYSRFYDTKSTCLNCGKEDYFEKKCPNCGSENILSGQKLQTISTKITGYPALMTACYNVIDLLLYLESGLMPNVEIGEKSLCLDCNREGVFAKVCPKCNSTNILSGAKYQLNLLNTLFPSTVAVNVKDVDDVTLPTANSAVLSMAKTIVKSTYKVEVIDDSSLENREVDNDGNVLSKTWNGKFKITNYSDENDFVISEEEIEVIVNNNTKDFVEQKISKALNKENTDDYSVTGLFAKKLNVDANGNHKLDDNGNCVGAETLNENGEPTCPFCAEIKKYALNPLDSFSKVCDTVISILTEQGVGDDGSNDDNEDDKATKKALYNALYKPYFEKQQAINKEIKNRQDEIAIIEGVWDRTDGNNPQCITQGLQQHIEECQQYIQEELNFEKHLGENLWLELCSYRREDKYSNSNYISDGLNNTELFEKANEFIEVAEEEIFKSAELQHSISATLNNLLSLPKFKPLLKSFKTGNWIRVQVDDEIYKLRLLEYGFNYGDSENISVDFSDVIKIKNGITDIQSILSQASSMASSYDSVQRQAQKADVARGTIDQWLTDGLNSANVRIQSNDSEEITLTQSGLLARSYDDITGTYLPEQFRLTHNIMAYTDDNWKTVSAALGKHNYKYYKDGNLVDAEGYGLSAKFAQAAHIIGSQIISGEIVSHNYEPNKHGTYFDLNKGDFEIAGGKIAYNALSDIVTLNGVKIVWDDGSGNATNAPTIDNINDLSEALDNLGKLSGDAEQSAKDYADKQDEALSSKLTTEYENYTNSKIGEFDEAVAAYLGLNGKTVFGDNYVISPYIGGGYLNITGVGNYANRRVIIDPNQLIPNNEFIFQVHNDEQIVAAIKTDGSAVFRGNITATSLTLLDGVTIPYDNIDNKPTKLSEFANDLNIATTDYVKIETKTDETTGITTTITTVGDKTYTTYTSADADYLLTNIGMGNTKPSEDGITNAGYTDGYFKVSKNGLLIANNAIIWGTVYATNGSFTGDIVADSLTLRQQIQIGNETDGYHTWINPDGVLSTENANISGIITAAEGIVGGFTIESVKDENGDIIGGQLYYGNAGYSDGIFLSTTDIEVDEMTAFFADAPDFPISDWRLTVGNNFGVTSEGHLYANNAYLNNAYVSGTITSSDIIGGTIEGAEIIGGAITSDTILYVGKRYDEDTGDFLGYNTWFDEDGILNAEGAKINGKITAIDGAIGGWLITDSAISKETEVGDKIYKVLISSNLYTESNGIPYNPVFAVYNKTDSTYQFYVRSNGALVAKDADINGKVTATSGNIGGWEIRNDAYHDLHYYDESSGRGTGFQPPNSGNWAIAVGYSNEDDWSIGSKFRVNHDGYLYAYDATFEYALSVGESDWTRQSVLAPRRLSFQQGSSEYAWIKYQDYTIGEETLEVYGYNLNLLAANKVSIKGDVIELGDYADSVLDVNKIKHKLLGNWRIDTLAGGSGSVIMSDINKKNSIEPLDARYDIFFDNLISYRFKYNDGTSDRYHTGFVAQDVQSNLKIANIPEKEFAGICTMKEDNETYSGLRYDEFVSLNTWQIQKLKSRVSELEDRLRILEQQNNLTEQ